MREVYKASERLPQSTSRKIVVFGHSPIKPLLLPEELTANQGNEWQEFIAHPLHGNKEGREPQFRVLSGVYARELREIQAREGITETQRQKLSNAKRIELQHNGRLVLNRIARVNALAAGFSLYSGITDELILSGAGTIPRVVSGDPVGLPEEVYQQTPSEAEMMQDIIVRTFGKLIFERDLANGLQEELNKKYSERYHTPVDVQSQEYQLFLKTEYAEYKKNGLGGKIKVEGKSLNTLENFIEILKLEPDLTRADIIAPGFHLERLNTLASLYSIDITTLTKDASLLTARAVAHNKENYAKLLADINNPLISGEQRWRVKDDQKWTKALIEPERVGYWLGYITEVDIDRLQNILDMLQSSAFNEPARRAFMDAGLDFDEFTQNRLNQLSSDSIVKLKTQLKATFHGKGKPAREKAVQGL